MKSAQKSILIIGAFIIALGLTGYVTFAASRELFVSWNISGAEPTTFIPQTPSPFPLTPEATTAPQLNLVQPLQPPDGPPAQIWDGTQRVTILLIGLDARPGDSLDVPPRSDALILLTFDPKTNTIGLLSIPRDLWVAIPGFENGKINTAYQFGEAYQTNRGGPGLAMDTVETLLGIPVDYYALADFQLFARFIDEIGGVKIVVPEQVEITVIDGITKQVFPGLQTLSGEVALAYIRTRKSPGGDFDRVQRQHLILMGIRNRVLDFDLIPTLIAKAPLLYGEFSDRIRTNLTANDIFKLAIALQGVLPENIHFTAITLNDVTFGTSPEGQEILLPLPERLRQKRDEVFVLESPLSSEQASKSISQLIAEEAAKIAIFNGTITPGLAAQATDFLKSENLNITVTDIASEIYPFTTLIDYTGNPYTVQYLMTIMNIRPTHIIHIYNPDNDVDIEITVGEDWLSTGDLP